MLLWVFCSPWTMDRNALILYIWFLSLFFAKNVHLLTWWKPQFWFRWKTCSFHGIMHIDSLSKMLRGLRLKALLLLHLLIVQFFRSPQMFSTSGSILLLKVWFILFVVKWMLIDCIRYYIVHRNLFCILSSNFLIRWCLSVILFSPLGGTISFEVYWQPYQHIC